MKRVARTAAGLLPFQSLSSQFAFQFHLPSFQYRYRTYRLPSELQLRMKRRLCHHPLNAQIGCIVFASETRLAPHTKYSHFLRVLHTPHHLKPWPKMLGMYGYRLR